MSYIRELENSATPLC